MLFFAAYFFSCLAVEELAFSKEQVVENKHETMKSRIGFKMLH